MGKFKAFRGLHWLVLSVCLGLTILAWDIAKRDAKQLLDEEFDFRVKQVVSRLEKRIQDSRMILRGTAGLFYASNQVTRKEFRAYVDSLQLNKNYPGINSIGVGMLVSAKNKAQFLNSARQEDFSQYEIWPAGEREEYAPVLYLEPDKQPTQRAFGFDMYSEPTRRAAMQEARDSGNSALTGQVKLVADTGAEPLSAFLIYVPLYRNGAQHDTVVQRRENLTSWVYLSFRMDDTVQGILSDTMGHLANTIAFEIYEGDAASADKMVYSSQAQKANRIDTQSAHFHSTVTLPLSNKAFTIQMHSLPAFDARLSDVRSIAVLIGGIVASLLFALIIWQLVHGRDRAIQIAKKMNHDLLAREKRYRQMFEDNASIAYMLNPESGEIVDANTAAAKFWGYSLDELRRMNISNINIEPFEELQSGMQQQISDGGNAMFHFRHKIKNGEVRDVEIYRSRITHEGSDFLYCIVHDITSRKQAERAVKESEEKLHAIIETAMDAVVQLDSDGAITDWNTRAEQIFGWPRQDMIGKVLVEILIPAHLKAEYEDGMRQYFEIEENNVRHSQFEIDALYRDGREFPVEIAITTMLGKHGKHEFCIFMHDITNRRKSENALRKARIELENRVFQRTAELVRTNKRLNTEIKERTQTQEALQQSQEMLRQLVAHQDQIRENERKRIAREIHDELGQHLLVLRIDVSMLTRAEREHPKLQERVEAILQHIDLTIKSVRAIINNLRPSVLDLGLHAALEWQAEEFQRRSGIVCELMADDDEMELDNSIATVLFRILQEALTNVLRHAQANQVKIELHREAGCLVMTIADNGIGIQEEQNHEQKSFGLVGIRERLHILNGEMNIDSGSKGTVLIVSVPLPNNAETAPATISAG